MDDLSQNPQLPNHIDQLPGPSKPTQHVTFALPPTLPPKEQASSNAGPIRRRRFSAAKIQPTRIKKVMQADEEIGRMVASVPVAIGRAMEHFAEKFLMTTATVTQSANCRTLTPAHMKIAVQNNPHFHFLEGIFKDIPVQAPASSASVGTSRPNDLTLTAVPRMEEPWKQMTMCSPLQLGTSTSLGGQQLNGITSPLMQSPMLSPMATSPMIISPQQTNPFLLPAMPSITPEEMQMLSPVLPSSIIEQPKTEPTLPEKPKRGRPKKLKKEDKCLDEELCREVTDNIEKEDKDRELMPPPSLPINVIARSRTKPVA